MLPERWTKVRRVVAIRLDNIGDIVMLGPALRTVRHTLPEAQITLMASPAGSQVAPMLPWVDDVMVVRALWQDVRGELPFDPAREQSFISSIRAYRFDAALIFTSFSQSPYPPAYLCYLAGIPVRLGQSKEFGGSVLTHWVPAAPDDMHQVDRNLLLLESEGFEVAGRHLELHLPHEIQTAADQRLFEIGIGPDQPFILLAPGASCAARRYDSLRFAEVAHALAVHGPLPIVIAGSTREQGLAAPILAGPHGGRIRSLVGRTSVPELAALVRRATLVVANNSAPLHMADAFRRPMVILYSGTEYQSQWRPRFAPSRLLRRDTTCSPCYAFQCPYNMECLDIPVDEVVQEILDLLRETTGVSHNGRVLMTVPESSEVR